MKLIVAVSQNGVIGNENKLPWHIKEDMVHFKRITSGNVVVMGRKTFESLPKGALPFRRNIVLTRDTEAEFVDTEVVHSVEELLELEQQAEGEEFFVIGGDEIYKQLEPYCNRMYVTLVDKQVEGDAFFHINHDDWALIDIEAGTRCKEVNLDYSFLTFAKLGGES